MANWLTHLAGTLCSCLFTSHLLAQGLAGLAYADSIDAALPSLAGATDSIEAYQRSVAVSGHLDPQRALGDYGRLIALARRTGKEAVEATARAGLAGPLIYTNQADSAERSVRHGISLYRRLGADSLKGGLANALMNLGLIYDMSGRGDSALVLFRQALPLSIDEPVLRGRLLGNMGAVYGSLNQMDSALAAFTSVVEQAREADDDRLLGMGLANVALVQLQLGRPAIALDLVQEQIQVLERQGDSVGLALAHSTLCNTYHELDSAEATQQACTRTYIMGKRLEVGQAWSLAAFILSERLDALDPTVRGRGLELMAEVVEARRDAPWADGNDPLFEARYAELLLADGRVQEAYQRAAAAVLAKRTSNSADPLNADRIYQILARTEYATGRLDSAEVHLAQATAFAREHYTARIDEGVAAAETQFRTRESERALLAERELREATEVASQAQRRSFLIIGALGLLLLAGSVYAYVQIRSDRSRIAAQSAERAVLLREIHHRVKNNLQVITGLLAKQGRTSSSEEVKAMMQEGQDRVHSMALVHQRLYEQDDLRSVGARSYFTELARSVRRGQYGLEQEIELDLAIEEVQLDMDQAIPLGMILNELLTNAYKYAFAKTSSGTVRVAFAEEEGRRTLVVEDSGIGLPNDFDAKARGRLGVNLVRGLTRQLGGTCTFGVPANGGGMRAEVQF